MGLLTAKIDNEWINEITDTPIFGGLFLFVLMFIPPVLVSFFLQVIVPMLNNDIGFTKAMLLLLPCWNFLLWHLKIKLYIFYIPAWIIWGLISFIKGILMISGIDDGQ
jgi:hypothetical protein